MKKMPPDTEAKNHQYSTGFFKFKIPFKLRQSGNFRLESHFKCRSPNIESENSSDVVCCEECGVFMPGPSVSHPHFSRKFLVRTSLSPLLFG